MDKKISDSRTEQVQILNQSNINGFGRLFGGQLMLTGLQADIGIQLCRGGVLRQTAQLPNDVPYRHPNETADARFFFIF